jgi:integrase
MTTAIGLYKDKASGKWCVRWFGKYNPAIGKQKRYCKSFERKVDAEKFQGTIKAEFVQGTERDPSTETIKTYSESWLSRKVKLEGIRPATVLLYNGTFDRLYGFFGPDRLLRTIKRNEAMDFLADVKPIKERIEPLSGWAKHRVLRQCKTLFSEAVKDGIISVNPFSGIKVSKGTPSEWCYLKPGEYLKLLDTATSLQEKVLYALCFMSGLRETEALTLRWVDVDFEKNRLHVVNQKATDILPPFDIKDTDARTVPVPKHTLDLLTKLQLESPVGSPYILITGDRFKLVCDKWQQCRQTGKAWLTRYWANNIIKNFHRRIKQAGIDNNGKKLTVHVLRKCCSQNWQNNFPVTVVMNWLGHSNPTTTGIFYSTVDEIHFDAALRYAENLLASAMTDVKLTFSGVSGENQAVKSPE